MVNFWDWKESDTHDAQLSELAEETSSHVEEENKSDDEGEEKEEMKEEKEGKEEEESAISEERLNTTKKALAFNNEFLHQKEDVENSAKMYGLFNSTSKDNVKKTRRSVPANLSTTTIPMRATTTTTIPMMRASPRRRRQLLPLTSLTTALGPSESPAAAAAVKERSLFNVEVRLTRLQEKVAMEEMKEERKKVPHFGLINLKISKPSHTISSEGAAVWFAQPKHLKEGEGSQEELQVGGDGPEEEQEDADCGIEEAEE